MKGFRITRGKGMHITFDNGYTVSIQIGPGNYCDNYDADFDQSKVDWSSETAETAVWGPDGGMIDYDNSGDTVQGYMTTRQVLDLLAWAQRQEAN